MANPGVCFVVGLLEERNNRIFRGVEMILYCLVSC